MSATPDLPDVERYYTDRLLQHGAVPQGVDWNGRDGQHLRFQQLLKIIDPARGRSVNDLGCGYGALLDELDARAPGLAYAGFDLSAEMVREADRLHGARPDTRFAVASRPDAPAAYGVASGIFNVRLERPDDEWWALVTGTLDALHETSTVAFAFNCLTSYSDADRMRPHLYYADPCRVFDHCKRRYSRHVALLHDYGLYEFTVHVRAEGAGS